MNLVLLAGFALQSLAGADISRMSPARAADSARVRRQARDAQSTFESRRVNLLPFQMASSGRCEERIGRMCYWWEGRHAPPMPAEPAAIAGLRQKLINDLERAAALVPGDDWVVGQLVRYLIEAERTTDAERVARERCRADPWWCLALAGWAAHEGERFGRAEEAFASALAAMPGSERCRWEDISDLLESPRASRYDRMSCDEKRAETARLMWIARPLLSADGNDLLTEHYARQTMERVLRASRSPHGMSWGNDLRELLVRYGWSVAWTRSRERSYTSMSAGVSGTGRPVSLYFFPIDAVFDEPATLNTSSWRLEDPRARTRYAPRWASVITTPRHQTARFLRGDTVVVLAAFDVSADTAFRDSLDAALVLAPSHPGPRTVVRTRSATRGRFMARAPRAGAEAVSLELLDRQRRAASRARSALPTANDAREPSELLLFDPDGADPPPRDLDDAAARMLTSSSVRTGSKTGVYWELYDLSRADSIGDVSLSVERERGGTWRRAAEAIGLVGRRLPVTLEWRDRTSPGSRIERRSVVVDLTGIPPGRYNLSLDVRIGRRHVRTVRRLDITP